MISRYTVFAVAALVAIVLSAGLAFNNAVNHRAEARRENRTRMLADRKLCSEIRTLDSILIIQLEAALARLNESVPDKTSAVYQQQSQILSDGIAQINEHTCK